MGLGGKFLLVSRNEWGWVEVYLRYTGVNGCFIWVDWVGGGIFWVGGGVLTFFMGEWG